MLMASGASLAASNALIGKASAAARKGGHLVATSWASSTADTLDPAKASGATDYVRCCASYNRLTRLDNDGLVQMELAESINTSDAKLWTIKLKSGITFHDGHTLNASDVVFSLRRHLDPAVGSKVNSIARRMQRITAIDPLTVEIELTASDADLPTTLCLHHFLIVADGTTDFSKGNGTGPFLVEVFEPGVRSVHARNPNYFKTGLPHLDSFEFFAIQDETTRVNALLAGQIHIAAAINPRSVRTVEASGTARAASSLSGNYTNLIIRLDMDYGLKRDFVEGMKYTIDRQTIMKFVFRGYGAIGNDQPISPANRYHNPNLKPRPHDLDRAKYHFRKAGVLGDNIPLIASDAVSSSVDMATVMQGFAAEAGVNLDIQKMPADGYLTNYWLKAPFCFGNIDPRPTPDSMFSLFYQSSAPWNESRYKSTKFDAMLLEARGMLDQTKRTEIYWEMQEMVANNAGTIIPSYISDITGLAQTVGGWEDNPLSGMMGYAFPEYCWLSDA